MSELIEHIQTSQAGFVAPIDKIEGPKVEKVLSLYDSGILATRCCPDLAYSIKRLIKGLGSSRDTSRLGFMLALLNVYHTFAELLDAEVILNWSIKLTSPEALGGSVKRREERLLHVARIFAIGALFRSKLGSVLSVASKKFAIDALISIGKKKSFLRESALEVIVCVVECAESSELSAHTLKKLAVSSALMTETLVFAILATSRFGFVFEKENFADNKFPVVLAEFVDLKNLLSCSNEESLLNVLKETPCFENRLHTVWGLVLASLNQEGCLTSSNFIRQVIEAMFLNSTGLVKRWTGLNLLKRVVELNLSGSIGFIFTPVVLRMIKGSLGALNVKSSRIAGKEISAFNSAVIQFFRDLIKHTAETQGKASEQIAMDLIIHLSKISSKPSGVISAKNLLEELAGDEAIISKLYSRLSTTNVCELIDTIANDIVLDFDTQNQSLATFQAPFDKLVGLIRNKMLTKLEGASEWIDHLVIVMARVCVNSGNMSEELRDIIKGRFYALLNELTDSKRFFGINWIERIATLFLNAASGSKNAEFSISTAGPISDAIENLKIVGKLLKKHKIEPERFSRAITSLQNYLTILIFLDPIEAIPVCSELAECLQVHFSKSSKKEENQSSLEAVMPFLVDILMTFLSKASQLTRKMCDDIFRNIIPFLSVKSMDVLFRILKSRDSEVFEEVDTISDVEESDSDDVEEIGYGVETVEDIDRAMKAGTDADDSQLSDVDDEQMLAFDEKLAEIFREKRKTLSGSSSKAFTKETKRSMIQFKFKVLELVNLAFKSGDLPVAIRIASINGLLEVISANVVLNNGLSSNTEQKQLFTKLESFFAEAFGRPSRISSEIDLSSAETLICELLERVCTGDKTINHAAVLPRVAQCVWYLVKLCRSLKIDESKIKTKFAELIKFAVNAEDERFRVFRSFVFTWSNWDLQYVTPVLVEISDELKSLMVIGAIRPYQRNQLFEFLSSLLKRAQSFNEKDPAIKLLELFAGIFTSIYTPSLSDELTKMKVEFFKDDLKFMQFCSKKHHELDTKNGSIAWKALLSTGLSNCEEFWKSQQNMTNSIKSFLGQLKSAIKQ